MRDHLSTSGEDKPFSGAVAKYMIEECGVKKLGTIGHCWGAKVGVLMGTNPPELRAHAGPHPSFLTKEDGLNVNSRVVCLDENDIGVRPNYQHCISRLRMTISLLLKRVGMWGSCH